MGAGAVVGIDIGGSGIKGAPVDLSDGTLTRERVRRPTPSPSTPEAVAAILIEVLEEIDVDGGIGITLPSVIRQGIVETAANIDERWVGVDGHALFAGTTGRSVGLLNDADAAGVAEMRYGAGRGEDGVVVLLTLGTGIGSAVFVDGDLVPNTELGHLHLHGGDAEHWAADSARDRHDLSWPEYARRVQDYLELLEQLLWPDLLILGGGVSKHAEKFLPDIRIRTRVVPATLLNGAGIVGAALFAPAD
ncbi:MAG TPA: ROK family protein [Actinomycetota bacterium]|nr:ROK family protein [Actinomycetota bacterium]